LHEFSAAQWIVDTVLREASRLGAREVREVPPDDGGHTSQPFIKIFVFYS